LDAVEVCGQVDRRHYLIFTFGLGWAADDLANGLVVQNGLTISGDHPP
jgi:hypothetical protein